MARRKSPVDRLDPPTYPVILSGGSGTRLWPLSRKLYPKQLLPLITDRSLFQETVARAISRKDFAPIIVVCNEDHRFIIAEQLHQLDATGSTIVLEPVGRNTASAVALAAILAARESPDALLLILPADHAIADREAFWAAADLARRPAIDGAIVTFGIRPDGPETGYGYVKQGRAFADLDNVFRVDRFIEKPNDAKARMFFKSGNYLWNSGMFFCRADVYLAELGRLQPEMLVACRQAINRGTTDVDFFRPDRRSLSGLAAVSIDHAIMEHTDKAAVVPADIGWSDVGSWSSLWTLGDKDADGNVLIGDVLADRVRSSYIRSDGRLLVTMGLEDIVIVATDDVVLAAKRDDAQDIRQIVAVLEENRRYEAVSHRTVFRPWGHFQLISSGNQFQVKRISVKPGAALSLQRHEHRAEHWVVVNGTARVTRGAETFDLEQNQSTYIPVEEIHRLANVGIGPLEIIEVQSGSYLGEDDIERLEDEYGRIAPDTT